MLPRADLEHLRPLLEPLAIKQRRVLHHDKAPMEHVYFIEEGLISVLAHIDEKRAVEVWLIGRDGLSGVPIVLGGTMSPHRRVVQLAGRALRMRADDVHAAMETMPEFRRLLLRYAQFVLVQASQSSACTSSHTVRQRLARWLLTAHDQVDGDAIPVTHSMLARLLGVRRATVSDSIAALERDGVVGKQRAQITVLDRDRLEEVSCLCYRVTARERERILCGHDEAPTSRDATGRRLDDGLSARSAGDRTTASRADGGRHLLAVLAGDRCAVQLPGGKPRRDT